MEKNKTLTKEELFKVLEERFESNPHRHRGVTWKHVQDRLKGQSKKIDTLLQMELTDGEPDVFSRDAKSGVITFVDFALQSPKGRRSVCYDQAAWDDRKEFKPKNGNAQSLAKLMGATLLTEEQYLQLQTIQDVDTTTSSWLLTPKDVREKGGALFGDKRFGRAFIFHNGADSYYADRGFRVAVEI
ncbi:MAG: DUF4256 domain-containing protein [Bacilli bacterium]